MPSSPGTNNSNTHGHLGITAPVGPIRLFPYGTTAKPDKHKVSVKGLWAQKSRLILKEATTRDNDLNYQGTKKRIDKKRRKRLLVSKVDHEAPA